MSQTYIPAALERLVWERSRGQCEYCRCLTGFHSDPFAIEHIVPESRGGSTEETNLALSCLGCNSFKGAFQTGPDPVTEREVPLFHPRRQKWTKHFAWSDDTTQVIGITATGRATVVRLRLNRPGLVNLRAALHRFGYILQNSSTSARRCAERSLSCYPLWRITRGSGAAHQ